MALLKQNVINGTVLFRSGDLVETASIAITDPSKTFYFYSYRTDNNDDPSANLIFPKLTGTPGNYQLEFSRTADTSDIDLTYQVLEFHSGVNVLHGTTNDAGFVDLGLEVYKDVTLASSLSDYTKAFCMVHAHPYVGPWDFDEVFKTKILDNNTVRFSQGVNLPPDILTEYLSYQVIEFTDNSTVQYLEGLMSSSSLNVTIPTAVDIDRTMVLPTYFNSTSSEMDNDNYFVTAELTNSTTVRLERGSISADPYFGIYVITIDQINKVVRDEFNWSGSAGLPADGAKTLSVTINKDTSAAFASGWNQMAHADGLTTQGVSRAFVRLSVSQTNGQVNVSVGSSYANTTKFQVLDFRLYDPSPPEPLVLKQIVRGEHTLSGGTSHTIALPIDLDPTKSILFMTERSANAPIGVQASRGDLVSAKITGALGTAQLVLSKHSDLSENPFIGYEIVEFSSGINVQRGFRGYDGYTDIGDDYALDIPITSVNTAKAFPLLYGQGYDNYDEELSRLELTSDVNLRLTATDVVPPGGGDQEFAWQVVELLDDSVVQTVTGKLSGVSSADVTIDAVDLSKAVVFVSYSVDENNSVPARALARAYFLNNTTVRVLHNSSLADLTYTLHVVDFADVRVLSGFNAISGASQSASISHSSVSLDHSVAFLSGYKGSGGTTNNSTAYNVAQYGLCRIENRTPSGFNAVRSVSGVIHGTDLSWFVVEFPTGDSPLGPSGGIGVGSPFIF